MFIPESIEKSLKNKFGEEGKVLKINNFSFSSGGCINSTGVIETNLGKMFIKWNYSNKYPGMFEAEAKGLKLLRAQEVIKVPEPILTGQADTFSYLLTEYVESSARAHNYWDLLGQNLAALHRISSKSFGLDQDNYIGSLAQINLVNEDWVAFFITNRLEYQLNLAIQAGKVDNNLASKFQKLYGLLPNLLSPNEAPNLIHGDLWSGNLMTGFEGEPVIFDPAVYFGHREIELAMTHLFGGFSSRFYDVYNAEYPFAPGINDRIQLYQLYPLLVHVNLFGGGYLSQVKTILNRFV